MELIREAPTERMHFDDGSWVDLRTRLTIGDRKSLTSAALVFEQDSEDPRAGLRPRIDPLAAELAGLRLGIVAWSLPDPVTPENIALLDEHTATAIKVALDHLWRVRSDDDRKNSSGGGVPPSAAAGDLPQNSDGSP